MMKLTGDNMKLKFKALWLIALARLFKGKKGDFKQTMAIFYQMIVKAAIFLPLFLIVAQSLMDVFHDQAVFLPFKTPPRVERTGVFRRGVRGADRQSHRFHPAGCGAERQGEFY